MLFDMFDKDEALTFRYGPVSKLIQDLRINHLYEGGDPVNFPDYLKEAGVAVQGPFMVVSDEFNTMAELKYGGKQ